MTPDVSDFADSIADYMATSITPWKDEQTMREAVRVALGLVFGEAMYRTRELLAERQGAP